jgi:hypothetical protein
MPVIIHTILLLANVIGLREPKPSKSSAVA